MDCSGPCFGAEIIERYPFATVTLDIKQRAVRRNIPRSLVLQINRHRFAGFRRLFGAVRVIVGPCAIGLLCFLAADNPVNFIEARELQIHRLVRAGAKNQVKFQRGFENFAVGNRNGINVVFHQLHLCAGPYAEICVAPGIEISILPGFGFFKVDNAGCRVVFLPLACRAVRVFAIRHFVLLVKAVKRDFNCLTVFAIAEHN